MLFQKKVDDAFEKLHEESENVDLYYDHLSQEDKREEDQLDLEKGDKLAMILSALLVIMPIAIIVLLVIALAGYFFLA